MLGYCRASVILGETTLIQNWQRVVLVGLLKYINVIIINTIVVYPESIVCQSQLLPSKHEAFNQCCFIVGPLSPTFSPLIQIRFSAPSSQSYPIPKMSILFYMAQYGFLNASFYKRTGIFFASEPVLCTCDIYVSTSINYQALIDLLTHQKNRAQRCTKIQS